MQLSLQYYQKIIY